MSRRMFSFLFQSNTLLQVKRWYERGPVNSVYRTRNPKAKEESPSNDKDEKPVDMEIEGENKNDGEAGDGTTVLSVSQDQAVDEPSVIAPEQDASA